MMGLCICARLITSVHQDKDISLAFKIWEKYILTIS